MQITEVFSGILDDRRVAFDKLDRYFQKVRPFFCLSTCRMIGSPASTMSYHSDTMDLEHVGMTTRKNPNEPTPV